MTPALIIAGKEVRDSLRNRWIVGSTLLLAGLAFMLTVLGSAPTGTLAAKPLAVTVVSLASLTIFLIPLIALLLSYDAIVGEAERGTMLLLLTYPVTRHQIIFGKFLGHCAILAFATIVGYGAAGVAASLSGEADAESWRAFAGLLASSVMLGAVFVALAYAVSASVRERSTAAGIAIGLWLLFVVLYDLGMLGLLVAGAGGMTAEGFGYLLLLNPADVYRLFNLTAFEDVRGFSGMAGLSGEVRLPAGLLAGVLAAWAAVPLAVAALLFRRREL